MLNITERDITTVRDLVPTLEDGRRGFGTVADSLTENGRDDLADTMRRLGAERGQMIDELRRVFADSGEEFEADGSAGGAIHRGWIAVKDALTGNDAHALLAAAEEGEDHAVEAYEDALESTDLSTTVRTLLSGQAAKVRAAHDQVRALRDNLA